MLVRKGQRGHVLPGRQLAQPGLELKVKAPSGCQLFLRAARPLMQIEAVKPGQYREPLKD